MTEAGPRCESCSRAGDPASVFVNYSVNYSANRSMNRSANYRQPLWSMGRRFGAGFFGAGFFATGAGLQWTFFTGAILRKLMMLSFVSVSFAPFAFDTENITGCRSQKKANSP